MDRQWLYPFYVIAILSLVLLLFGCDGQSAASFSVEIQVEDKEGMPIDGATVGVRPCYEIEQEVRCGGNPMNQRTQAGGAKDVSLADWEVRTDGRDAILTWTTASETDNAGFEVETDREGIDGFRQVGFVDGQGTTEDSTNYSYRYEDLSSEQHTFRLVAVATDGSSRVVGEPETIRVRTSIEPSIQPLSPNPVQRQAVFGAAVSEASAIRSTVHAIDGAVVQTIVQDSIQHGAHRFGWNVGHVPTGIYEHRTRIQTNGDVVAQDTTYAVVAGRSTIGTTKEDGTVSTSARTRFPALYDVPPIQIRDPNAIVLDTLRVAPTVEFVVTVNGERHTFQRTISEGENTLTLSPAP